MKKTLKVLLPILLALLIIASVVWYFMVYDREFTRDMLLNNARYFTSTGNHGISSWFYDLAYNFSAQDEDVAIELANQYKREGNYTKAEYTLSHAIADGGTLDLYIALCKTYVEQDKLLDAVTMLDNVTDMNIRSQLDAIRPAAPVSDPETGFYTQYITVSLSGSDGILYYTLDGEYPSINDEPYLEPVTLPAGETNMYALTVAENGLVSPLSILGFTVGGVIEPVTLDDPATDQAVRGMLAADADETLYTSQLWTITEFTVPEKAVVLSDLTKLPYLESLTIHDRRIESLQFLTALPNLKELDLSGCRISSEDIGIIASLPALQKLNLSNCGLSTIAGLDSARNLTVLDLSDNTLRNLDPIATLVNLKEIHLQHNAVVSLSAMSALDELAYLDVSHNALTSLAQIASCSKLDTLIASNNRIETLEGIGRLSALTHLSVSSNELTDISPAAGCPELLELHAAKNSITDISAAAALTSLETFDFSHNQVTELPKWPDGSALRTIDGSYNQLTSLNNLSNMTNLTHVYMDYNEITSVAVLESCYNLVMVNIYGNAITGVEALTAHDIIVNYDPTTVLDDKDITD